jgi:UDP-N-acetylglucosamine acyltransferase
MAGVVGDVIPYGMVIGNHAHLGGLNIVGMKRSGMQRAEIHMLRHAVRMLFDRTKPVRDRAADVLAAFPESQAVADMITFISVDAKRAYTTPPLDAAHGGVGHDSDES